MCNLELLFLYVEVVYGICFVDYFVCEFDVLCLFECDGLLMIVCDCLMIYLVGWMVVCNIVMVFDVYFG